MNHTMQLSIVFGASDVEQLVLPHRKSIFSRALQLCRDPDVAQDLVQQTIIQGIINIRQLRDRAKSKYWLLSILKNQFFMEYSRSKKIDYGNDEKTLHYMLDENSTENDFLEAEQEQELHFLIESLEEHLRIPLQMFYFQSFSYKKISAELDIPIGTVMSRISRAKACLKMKLLRRPESIN